MRGALPAPGAHGGDGARLAAALGVGVEEVLDLSASLNPVAPDPLPVVLAHLESIRRYPDDSRVVAALADALAVDRDLVVVTNGGAEAIALVAAHMKTGWVEEPDFSLYQRHLAAIDPLAPRWRSNPHNPTGLLAGPLERAAMWDEAFWPLATGSWTRGDHQQGSIVVGSLTKLFACPGLRGGYIVCPDDRTAAGLRALRPEWSLNSLAAAALPEMLEQADLTLWSKLTAELRQDLVALLRRRGYEPRPSDANWVLADAPDLRQQLAARRVLVRDCASFGMHGTVRIAVPDAQGLERLAAALPAGGAA